MQGVQIFGLRKSQTSRAAERFFKERGVALHFVDLAAKPMAPGEIRRFVEKFGLRALVDREGKAWVDSGLAHMVVSDADLLRRIEENPALLRLPLVRAGNRISIGGDSESWKEMAAEWKSAKAGRA